MDSPQEVGSVVEGPAPVQESRANAEERIALELALAESATQSGLDLDTGAEVGSRGSPPRMLSPWAQAVQRQNSPISKQDRAVTSAVRSEASKDPVPSIRVPMICLSGPLANALQLEPPLSQTALVKSSSDSKSTTAAT